MIGLRLPRITSCETRFLKSFCLVIVILLSCLGTQSSEILIAGENPGKEVVCFVYHRFDDSRYPSTNISTADFEGHLAYLVANNFRVLSLTDAIRYLQSAEPIRKTAVITIDDGYKSFFDKGLPLLKKYGLPATLFINTETVGGDDYMGWDELRTAMHKNIEIGNHTHSHAYFLNEPASSRYESFSREITLSQSLLSKFLDIKPTVFSYPYGELDEQLEMEVKRAGFVGAVAQNSGVIQAGSNLFRCPRFPMSESYAALDKFIEKASMHALRVSSTSPPNFSPAEGNRPELILSLEDDDLRFQEIQCFVQGGGCALRILSKKGNVVSIAVQATQSIAMRRRTLYTVTVPDRAGGWRWYSHLWINAAMK